MTTTLSKGHSILVHAPKVVNNKVYNIFLISIKNSAYAYR